MSGPQVKPHALLDAVIAKMQLKNDAALARCLEVAPPVLSKVRNHALPVGPALILRLHEATDMPIKQIRELAAA